MWHARCQHLQSNLMFCCTLYGFRKRVFESHACCFFFTCDASRICHNHVSHESYIGRPPFPKCFAHPAAGQISEVSRQYHAAGTKHIGSAHNALAHKYSVRARLFVHNTWGIPPSTTFCISIWRSHIRYIKNTRSVLRHVWVFECKGLMNNNI